MRIALPLTALTAIAVLTATSLARADEAAQPSDRSAPVTVALPAPEAEAAPPERYPPPIVRLKLIALGVAITGAAWGGSFASGQYWSTVPGAAELRIPVVGPWIALGRSGCASDDPNCPGAKIGVRAAIYILDGIAQAAGLALITEAIVMKTSPREKKSEASIFGLRYRGIEVSATPITSPTMHGVGLIGKF